MKRVVKNGQTGSRQAYRNGKKFDPNKYKLEKERVPGQIIDRMTSLCCRRCCEILSWKVDYGKYEPLQQARKCNLCSSKTVLLAHHRICQNCAQKEAICAKCQKPPGLQYTQSNDDEILDIEPQEDDGQEHDGKSKFSFVDEVSHSELEALRGLDTRALARELERKIFENEKERVLKLRERERRTVLRKNFTCEDECCSDEEL